MDRGRKENYTNLFSLLCSDRVSVPSVCTSAQGTTDLTLNGEVLFHAQIYHFYHLCVTNTFIFLNKNASEFPSL